GCISVGEVVLLLKVNGLPKLPPPVPSRMEILCSETFAAAMSIFPSRLKSPAASQYGFPPEAKLWGPAKSGQAAQPIRAVNAIARKARRRIGFVTTARIPTWTRTAYRSLT